MALLRRLALLLALVACAAAADTAPHVCDPSALAMAIAHYCVSDRASSSCCDAVRASVDLCGGVPCLCIVAGEAPIVLNRLNSSALLAIYAACGGLRAGGAACAVPPSHPVDVLPVIPVPPVVPRRRHPPPPPGPGRRANSPPAVPGSLPPPPRPGSGEPNNPTLLIIGIFVGIVLASAALFAGFICLVKCPRRRSPRLGGPQRRCFT